MSNDRFMTMGAGEIADLLDKNELEGRDLFNCIYRAMVLLREQASQPVSVQGVSEPVKIAPEEMEALKRFEETALDGEGYDVPKPMMARLAEIGLIRRTTANYYMFTEFGNAILASQPVAPVQQGLADEQIIEKCRAAGICWLVPDADPDGFPGGFDMASMHAMRSLLSHAPKSTAQAAPQEFEEWLRTVCFQAPTPEAYDLAKCAWQHLAVQATSDGWQPQEAGQVERLQRWASWILINRPEHFKDHACKRCVPHSDILVDGFSCVYHEAHDVVGGLAAAPSAPSVSGDAKYLNDSDMASLLRFNECCEDSGSGGHDVLKPAMKRMEEIGIVRSIGFGRHEITSFGRLVIDRRFNGSAPLPLVTYEEACARAAIAAQSKEGGAS